MGRKRTETVACALCGRKIPKARLEALPGIRVCVQCSTEPYKRDVAPDGPDPEDLIHQTQNSNEQS